MSRLTESTYTTEMNDYGWVITFEFEIVKGRVSITYASIQQEHSDMKTSIPLKMFMRSDLTDIELMIEVELEERRERNRPRRSSNIHEPSGLPFQGEI